MPKPTNKLRKTNHILDSSQRGSGGPKKSKAKRKSAIEAKFYDLYNRCAVVKIDNKKVTKNVKRKKSTPRKAAKPKKR